MVRFLPEFDLCPQFASTVKDVHRSLPVRNPQLPVGAKEDIMRAPTSADVRHYPARAKTDNHKFTNPQGPDQGFEVLIHAVFGLLLVPFFLGLADRLRGAEQTY
jgi:hypothetical protein